MAASITTTATTLEGQFLEIASALLIAESANKGNDNNPLTDNIQLTEDGDAESITVTAVVPVTLTAVAGGMTSVAVEFLP